MSIKSQINKGKTESDLATLCPGPLSLRSARTDFNDEIQQISKENTEHLSLLHTRDKQTFTQLTSEAGTSVRPDQSRIETTKLLLSLAGKIDVLMQKSNIDESNTEVSDIYGELQKLVDAATKQREDFIRLSETVIKQKEMLKKLEALVTRGKFRQSVSSERLVAAVQCCQDLEEERGNHHERSVVFLICGQYEFRRKMLQCGNADLLNIIDVPEVFNTGNRMLLGRQDYPHILLQTTKINAIVNSQTAVLNRSHNDSGNDLGAIGGSNILSKRACPVCNMLFPADDDVSNVFSKHVYSHFD